MKRLFAAIVLLFLPVLAAAAPDLVGAITTGGPRNPDGTEVQVDLPADQLKRNIPSKGLGCCVFRSIEYAGRWQNVRAVYDLPEWMVKHGIAGGGYPEKVTKILAQLGKEKGKVDFIQYTGSDLNFLRAALAGGRLPGVTYNGHDGVHYRGKIAHMTNLVHLDDKWAVVRDNNFPKGNDLVWMTPAEFKARWTGGKQGWAVILLSPPPPPPPHN